MTEPGPERYARVCRLADLRPGQGRVVVLEGRSVALFRAGDSCHAVSGRCPHNGLSLHDGSVSGGVVTCRWHGWRFDLSTGATPGADPRDGGPRIRVYPVRIVDGWVEVGPAPAGGESAAPVEPPG